MSGIIERLRAAREIPQVALQSYIALRGKAPAKLICVFEGYDDYPYYDTVIRRIRENYEYTPLIVNGKDQVLGLRKILSTRSDFTSHKVAYFIDKDFDGYKGHSPSDDIYCTHGYSIENNLCDLSTLPELLHAEYMCLKIGDDSRTDEIILTFQNRFQDFFSCMETANLAIYSARKAGIKLNGIESQITKYINISLEEITIKSQPHSDLVGYPQNIDIAPICESHESDFKKLSPFLEWRGKFVMGLYTELLHKLKDDRCSSKPLYFDRRTGMKFNPKGDIIRTLALLSPIPQCLRAFLNFTSDKFHTPAPPTSA